jgi:hypothetical protein
VARGLKLRVIGIKLYLGEIKCKFYVKNVVLRGHIVCETVFVICLRQHNYLCIYILYMYV